MFLPCCYTEEGARELSGGPFLRTLIPFMRPPPSWPHFPKAPPPNTITLGNGSQHTHFGRTSAYLFSNQDSSTAPCLLSCKCVSCSLSSTLLFFFVDYTKAFDCVDHNKLWKILRDGSTSTAIWKHQFFGAQPSLWPNPHICTWILEKPCLLRNLYADQEATVRTGHGTADWFWIGKGVCQGCILSPYLFNVYAEYIMWNAGFDESQAGISITGEISIISNMQMIPL